jgi:two-component system cell cycle response regulator
MPIAPALFASHNSSLSATKHHLLLVLSDRSEQDYLAGHLSDVSEVLFAKTDQEAMRVLETCPVHLVIVHGSGGNHGLCLYIKSSCRYAHIPVIELIPRDSFTIRLQCLESGADAWLENPVSRHILLAQVANLLTNRARISEHFATAGYPLAPAIFPAVRTDEALWKKLNQVIQQHLSNTGLDIEMLARHLCMSRPTLYRKIAEMSQMSPSELITLIRLNNAAALLILPSHSIGDVTRMVGFTTRSGFGKAFAKRYQLTPSAYRDLHRIKNRLSID